MKKLIFYLLLISSICRSQSDCNTAQPFCTSVGASYPASVGTTSQVGPNYGCLFSQPSPAWFYLNIATAGNIQIDLSNSANHDIDFALWGPFSSQSTMCAGITSSPISCSYSTSSTETANITNAQVGQWYVMVITNYANTPTNIFAVAGNAPGIDGTTNCNIICNTSVSSNNVTCFGLSNGTATATGGGTPPYTYSWNTSPVQNTQISTGLPAGTYTVTVVDSVGCISTATTTITQPNQLISIINQHNDVSCNGLNDGLLGVTTNGGTPPYTYIWSNGQNLPTIDSLSPGSYTVNIIDNNGCNISLNDTIVQPPPLVASYTTTPLNGCVPITVTYTNTTLNTISCVWTINGTANNNCSITQTYTVPGVYNLSLTVTGSNGCVSTSPTIISNVYSNPVSSFTSNPTWTNMSSPNISFNNSSTPGNYFWNFGDGTTSSDQSPSHIYTSSGTYTIQLIVVTQNGCVDTSYQKVYIDDEFTIYFPNTFTPNGDGRNDTFFPVFSGVNDIVLYIYDRWGIELYKSGDPWDGRYHDRYVEEDVYTWKAVLTDNKNKQHDFIGRVTVVK